MATKMRVRELSTELDISNKELLHLLRDLGIQVKSHMSTIPEEEVERVRERFSESAKAKDVTEKVTQSGVIVRRRRKQAPAEKEEPAPVQEAKEEPAAPEAAEEKAAQPAPEEEVPAEHEEAAGAATPEEEAQAGAPPEPEPEEPVQEPAEATEAEAPAEEATKRKPRKKAEQPTVKVISKPEIVPDVTPERRATGLRGSGAPLPTPERPEPKKKKKKKDKRVVDVSGMYGTEEERRRAAVDWKQRRTVQIKDKTGGKVRPGKRRPGQGRPAAEERMTTQPTKAAKRKIKVEEAIRVTDMARQMGVKAQEVIKVLMGLGVMATINHSLDIDTAGLVASEFSYEVEKVGFSEQDFILPREEEKQEDLQPRPPVVTIMGHVDHGKTSLLDAIRQSKITAGEAGGITQHIGAYHVPTGRGDLVFLDTPGHEAFTAMRARGAQVTDIVILVVAADDGVMDQTREAINHSRAAGVPIIVAVNKIDKENADLDRVKRELSDQGLQPEDWGGDTIFANVSAKEKIGIDELLEMVLLQAEVLELKANPDKKATGHIVEARLDVGRGSMGTVLVESGTLKQGDAFICGVHYGKVRAMFNDQGQKIDQAGPAIPVEVQGFGGVPEAGDEFVVVEDEKIARRIAESRQVKQRERELAKESKVTLESFLAAKADEEVKSLNLVIKADVQGSLEAITEALNKQSTAEVKVTIIHGGAGAINESDIMLAAASSAIIIGFNIRPTAKVKEVAEQEGVEIRFYNVIYHLVNEIRSAMEGMLSPIIREEYLGQAEVKEVFSVPKIGKVAGCSVVDGKLMRNAGIRLLRDGVVMYTGRLSSLKRFKDDAKEVAKGYECGVGLENFNDIKEGDVIEAFQEVEEKATL